MPGVYISKVDIRNFRSLKNFSITLEKGLSVIVGRNNTGKTSFLIALNRFINDGKINFYDLNTEFSKFLCDLLTTGNVMEENDFNEKYSGDKELGVFLSFDITYDDDDDLSNLSNFMIDLDENVKTVSFKMKFVLTYDNYKKITQKLDDKEPEAKVSYIKKHINDILVWNAYSYFQNGDKECKHCFDKRDQSLGKLIAIETIRAPRDFVKNNSKTLSELSNEFFQCKKIQKEKVIENFEASLVDMDKRLKDEYVKIFDGVFKKIREYIDDEHINPQIVSELSAENLLRQNVIVKYQDDLPEYNNGLGYLNLIAILFDIQIFAEKQNDGKRPDISLLCIEEPEAHTHPQLQYIFIKQIKNLIGDKFQSIISSHSTHVVSQSNFEDIRYFYIGDDDGVHSKSLTDLHGLLDDDVYIFFKKYLTVNLAELFFADKVIFIEGNTERILLPIFIEKLRQQDEYKNIRSKNVSIFTVGGAYAYKFRPLIDFLNIKCLIITDVDYKKNNNKNRGTTNATIRKLIPKHSSTLADLIGAANEEVEKNKLYLAFQRDGTRSFEDAFFEANKSFIIGNVNRFSSLKNKSKIAIYEDKDEFAERFVKSKTGFAMDVLILSQDNDYKDWKTPTYIEEGLKWLMK